MARFKDFEEVMVAVKEINNGQKDWPLCAMVADLGGLIFHYLGKELDDVYSREDLDKEILAVKMEVRGFI